jgi:predicted component of type VI protein secretion system
MQYKTITLNLIQENAPLHERLRQSGTLLETLHQLAVELRDRHLDLRDQLTEATPKAGADDPMLNAQAMELAVAELQERLADGWTDSGE